MKALLPIVFCLLVLSARAQSEDTVATRFKKDFRPSGLRIGADLIGPVRGMLNDQVSMWEVTADVDFFRYLLVVDYGRSSLNARKDETVYNNDGTYWRVGLDANFLTRDIDRNVFFLGLHYGRSTYGEAMTVIPSDPNWSGDTRTFSNPSMKASWMELNGGLKVKLWTWLWLGYTARFKFALSSDKSREMLSYEVPGYGRTDKENTWGFNYYAFFRLPFRKTGSILPPRK